MRFSRLNLDKYGHLTGVDLEFSQRTADMHILMGVNEAGKSTTQAAIADFLYGFEHITNYAYLHGTRDLRVGARMDSADKNIMAWRKKARNGSLQDSDGNVIDENVIAALLFNVDRTAFNQQFNLNHQRLREGGKAILEASDDVGRMLFQAGAGLDCLGDWLRRLDEQSDVLFKPKGSNQALAVALAQRDAALREKKEASLQAKVFKEAKDAEQQACIDLAAQKKALEEIGSKRKGLERARRVIPILRKIDQAVIGIEAIGAVPAIAGDIVQEFPHAVQRCDEAKTAANVAANEFDMAQNESASIVVDAAILERKDEIQIILGDLRSRFNTAESDIPRRTAELKAQETIILNKRKDISLSNLTPENVGDFLPKRAQINALRRLATEQKSHDEAINAAQAGLKKTEANLSKAQQEAAGFGKIYDLSELKLALSVALDDSGLETRIKQTEERVASLRSQTDLGVSRLVPGKPSDVKRVDLPSLSTVTKFSEDLEELDRRIGLQQEKQRELEVARIKLDHDRESLISISGAVPRERLDEARQHRDVGWELVCRRLMDVNQADIAEEIKFSGTQTLHEAMSEAIKSVDSIADKRFDAAENSGILSAKIAAIKGLDAEVAQLSGCLEKDEAERTKFLERWRNIWASSGIVPELPAAMAKWLAALEDIEAKQLELQDAENGLKRERNIEARYRNGLATALVNLGAQPDPAEQFSRTLKLAKSFLEEAEKKERDHAVAASKVVQLSDDQQAAVLNLSEETAALKTWKQTWANKLAEWSLPANTEPDDVETILDAWDAIRKAYEKISDDQGLRHRIAAMEADKEQFIKRLDDLLAGLAPDLANLPKLQAAQELERRFKQAESNRDLKVAAERNVDARRKAHEQSVRRAAAEEEAVAKMLTEIGVETVEAAHSVLIAVKQKEDAEIVLADLRKSLEEAGSGLPETPLRKECSGIQFDMLDAQIAGLDADDTAAVNELQRLTAILTERKKELAVFMEANAAAAIAAEKVERASSTALQAAERYIRLKSTSVILRHAIDRYRHENEAPLLRRASALFRDLTLQKYDGLEVDRDGGHPTLFARETDKGGSVPISGLSDGTRDQLYLALRLAGVEELIAKGTVLPFVADDLFVNFDDERAVAGLKILADLSTRTQVLFFTHHQHLVDLAKAAIPEQFGVLGLAA